MNIGIIGSGINGLFTAWYLKKAGHQVTVLDKGDGTDSCSHGNAGMIVPSHIIPLSAPGMVAKGLRWMLRADSPFYIRPRLHQDLIRWGWLFYKNANAAHVERSIPVLRDLSLLSKQLYQEFVREAPFNFGWHERGLLMLYQTPAMAHEEAEGASIANHAGIEAQVLSSQEVQALEPEVEVRSLGGVFYPGDAHLTPGLLIAGLQTHLKAQGVAFHYDEKVTDIEISQKRVTGVIASDKKWQFDELIVAAGAWSPELAQKMDCSLILQGGKGYSFMVHQPKNRIQIPAIMLEARATATPMINGMRFAGTMEIAGTDLSVNMRRVQGIVAGVRRFYPGFELALPDQQTVWSGLRPCSPDGLPYIGRLNHLQNVTIATGHGMMGLSLGPATGKLISEIVMASKTSVNTTPFRVNRY